MWGAVWDTMSAAPGVAPPASSPRMVVRAAATSVAISSEYVGARRATCSSRNGSGNRLETMSRFSSA